MNQLLLELNFTGCQIYKENSWKVGVPLAVNKSLKSLLFSSSSGPILAWVSMATRSDIQIWEHYKTHQ